ncbi:MAG: PilW family protein [Motiliproteus sp.]
MKRDTQPFTIVPRSARKQQGLSMIELMISLAISAFLMLGVFQIFIGSSSTDKVSHAFARVQENGRLALDILSRNLRMAGYQGCIDPEIVDMNIIADNAPISDMSDQAIWGYETDTSAWNVTNRDDNLDNISGVHEGSDLVYIQYVSPTGINVICDGGGNSCTAVNANIKVDDNSIGLSQYDIALVTDCESADMFRIVSNNPDTDGKATFAHSNSHNTSNNLSKAYSDDSQVMTFEALAFYVKDTGRNTSQGNDIYALYLFDSTYHDGSGTGTYITGREQELVEGVEQLQILYGQRLSDGNMRFIPADDSNLDFSEVEAIRIGLLVSSSDAVVNANDAATYKLPGEDVLPVGTALAVATHPVDRRLRQVFNSTIVLRNRK